MTLAASHRSTTSSRKPGAEVRGVVYRVQPQVFRCEACGSWRLYGVGRPHSPHFVSRAAGLVLVDCTGAEVRA